MRILDYLPNSTVDGVGIRQVFFTAGCEHHCSECHNPESWNPEAGEDWDNDEIVAKILNSPFDVTFTGGDAFLQWGDLQYITKTIKSRSDKNIWVYTGYTFDEIQSCVFKSSVLPYIDVLVDGRFDDGLKDPTLRFRGSSNQRIIDVKLTMETGHVTWLEGGK